MSPYGDRDQSIVGHGDAGEIYIRDGYFHFRRMDTTVDSSIPVKPGKWQQVVGTWDGVDIKIYVDGQLAGTVESTRRPSSVSTFYVGYGELAPWFRGTIDEVAYYGTALPAARVYQHFIADPPPGGQGPSGRTVTGGPSEPGVPNGNPDNPPPDTGPSAACKAANADLVTAEQLRDRASAKVKRLKQHHASRARQKQAKAQLRQAQQGVSQAQAVFDARC
jgi:hypothetical protein